MMKSDVFRKASALVKEKKYAQAADALLRSGTVFSATAGLDGRPQARTAAYAFERDGALYFLTLKSSRAYAELSKTPYTEFCVCDATGSSVFRLSGKACFTEDEQTVGDAALSCPGALEKAGGELRMLIAYFLTGAKGMIEGAGEELGFSLPDPSGVLIGITFKKKAELRDRLSRILQRRESDPPPLERQELALFDGALFVFAAAAKELFPRMDIMPLERSAVFETYDEREEYTARAASIIGNAVIDKPEDLTWWLDHEKWRGGGFSG